MIHQGIQPTPMNLGLQTEGSQQDQDTAREKFGQLDMTSNSTMEGHRTMKQDSFGGHNTTNLSTNKPRESIISNMDTELNFQETGTT